MNTFFPVQTFTTLLLGVVTISFVSCLPISSYERLDLDMLGESQENHTLFGQDVSDTLTTECILLKDCCDNIPTSHNNYSVLVDVCYEAFFESNGSPKDPTGDDCSSLLCGVSESWVTECQPYACALPSCELETCN